MASGESYGLFWNSNEGDRKYSAESFEMWLKKFFTSGVFYGDCMVTSTVGLTINVGEGYANVDGKVRMFSETNLLLSAPNSTYPRIDTIVIERNNTDRNIFLKAVTGAYNGTNPSPTAPVRDEVRYQLVLAQIYVGPGVTNITQDNITDKRPDPAVCGFVAGAVQQIDFSQITAQYDAYMAKYKIGAEEDYQRYLSEMVGYLADLEARGEGNVTDIAQVLTDFEAAQMAAFMAWFQNIQTQLDGDTAGHLQNEIDEHEARLLLLERMVIQDHITAPINLNESGGTPVLLVDEYGYAILSEQKHQHA